MNERMPTKDRRSGSDVFHTQEPIRWPMRMTDIIASGFAEQMPSLEIGLISLADVSHPSQSVLRRYASKRALKLAELLKLVRHGTPLSDIALSDCDDEDLANLADRLLEDEDGRERIRSVLLEHRCYIPLVDRRRVFFSGEAEGRAFIDRLGPDLKCMDQICALDGLKGMVDVDRLIDMAILDGDALGLPWQAETLRRHGVDLERLIWRLIDTDRDDAAVALACRVPLRPTDEERLYLEADQSRAGRFALIASHWRFAHLPLAERSVKWHISTMPSFVLDHLDSLPVSSGDLRQILDWWIERQGVTIYARNPEKTLRSIMRAVPPEEVVRVLCEANQNELAVFCHRAFHDRGYSLPEQLVAGCANANPYGFLRGVPSPAPPGPDYPALTERLVRDGFGEGLLEYLYKLPPGSVGPKTLALLRSDRFPQSSQALALDALIRQGTDASAWAEELIERGAVHLVVMRLETFIENGFDLEMLPEGRLEEFLSAIPIALAAARQQFAHIWAASVIERRLGRNPTRVLSEDGYVRAYRALRRDGRVRQWGYLSAYGELAGYAPPSDDDEIVMDESGPARALIETAADEFVPHESAFEHYVDDAILHRIRLVAERPDADSYMEYSARSLLFELNAGVERRVRALNAQLRRYLVVAVTGELAHQSRWFAPSLWAWADPDPESFLKTASVEQVLELFSRAAFAFRQPGWGKLAGGERWAKIAEAGYALWATPRPSRSLIDHVFDLEHNCGGIFDKDPMRVQMDGARLGAILDAKARVVAPEGLLRELPRGAVPSALMTEALERLARSKRLVERYV